VNGAWVLKKTYNPSGNCYYFRHALTSSGQNVIYMYQSSTLVHYVVGNGSSWSNESSFDLGYTTQRSSTAYGVWHFCDDTSSPGVVMTGGEIGTTDTRNLYYIKFTEDDTTATYPLIIKCIGDGTTDTHYNSNIVIQKAQVVPFDGTAPNQGMIKSGYVEVETYGDLHMNDIETIIKPIY
jgi:hypothetical protein